jgi:hypothetical protein
LHSLAGNGTIGYTSGVSTATTPLGAGMLATLRLLPSVSRWRTAALAIAVLVAGLLPTAFLVASGVVVGRIPGALRSGGLDTPAGHRLVAVLALAAALYVAQQVAQQVMLAISETMGRQLNGILRARVMRASLGPQVRIADLPWLAEAWLPPPTSLRICSFVWCWS